MMPNDERPQPRASQTRVIAMIIAGALVILAGVLLLARYLPRQTAWPLIRLLPGADAFANSNPDAFPELTILATAFLMLAEIAVLAIAGWTAWEVCVALARVPPHPLHVSYRSLLLFAAWCCLSLLHMWLVRSYIGVIALPVDSIGGVILESVLVSGAAMALFAGRQPRASE